jgi:branched-chain amino acid aminotransferase
LTRALCAGLFLEYVLRLICAESDVGNGFERAGVASLLTVILERSAIPPSPYLAELQKMSQRCWQRLFQGTLPATSARRPLSSRHARWYSVQVDAAPRLADIDPAQLTVTKTSNPKALLPLDQLVFGRSFTGQRANSHTHTHVHTVPGAPFKIKGNWG